MKKLKVLISYILLSLIISILVAFVTYKNYEVQQIEEKVNAEISIKLTNAGGQYSNPEYMSNHVVSDYFLFRLKEKGILVNEIQDIQSKIKVSQINQDVIKLETSDESQSLITDLESIAMGIVHESNNYYEQVRELIDDTIFRIEKGNVSTEDLIDSELFLYDLKMQRLNLEESIIVKNLETEIISGQIVDNRVQETVINFLMTFGVLLFIYLLFFLIKDIKINFKK